MFAKMAIAISALVGSSVGVAQVITQVHTEGSASYFYEEHHPTKFDFSTFTFCLGKNSHSEQGAYRSNRETYTDNEGNVGVFTGVGTTKGAIDRLLNQRVSWKSIFDQEEYVFHVKFKKQVGRQETFYRRNICNTRTWNYRVDEATSEVHTSVNIIVPDNVWVVQIRPQLNQNINQLVAEAHNVRGLSEIDKMPVESILDIKSGVRYFFVRPGDEIQLNVSLQDEGGDIDFIADFEVTFIGHNRCDKIIDNFKQRNGYSPENSVDPNLIRTGFDNIVSRLQKDSPTSQQEFHDSVVFMGCFTSPQNITQIIYDNNAQQMEAILSGMSRYERRISDWVEEEKLADPSVALSVKTLRVVQKMTQYALSASVLQTMEPLCERYPYLVDGRIVGQATGYLYVRQQLEKIGELAGFFSREEETMDIYFERLLPNFNQLPGQTYREVLEERRPYLIELFEGYEANKKHVPIANAMGTYSLLPYVEPTRDWVEFHEKYTALYKTSLRLNGEIYYQLDGYILEEDNIVDVSRLESFVAEFSQLYRESREAFLKLYSLFDGHYAEVFARSVDDVTERHFLPSEYWLSHSYGGFLKQFVEAFAPTSSNSSFNVEEISACLRSPIMPGRPAL